MLGKNAFAKVLMVHGRGGSRLQMRQLWEMDGQGESSEGSGRRGQVLVWSLVFQDLEVSEGTGSRGVSLRTTGCVRCLHHESCQRNIDCHICTILQYPRFSRIATSLSHFLPHLSNIESNLTSICSQKLIFPVLVKQKGYLL